MKSGVSKTVVSISKTMKSGVSKPVVSSVSGGKSVSIKSSVSKTVVSGESVSRVDRGKGVASGVGGGHGGGHHSAGDGGSHGVGGISGISSVSEGSSVQTTVNTGAVCEASTVEEGGISLGSYAPQESG